jgi:hypothetical protein
MVRVNKMMRYFVKADMKVGHRHVDILSKDASPRDWVQTVILICGPLQAE